MLALLSLLSVAVVDGAVDGAVVGADGGPARVTIVVGHGGAGDDTRSPLRWADDDAARLFLAAQHDSDRAFLLTTFDDDSARRFPELTTTARPPTKAELGRVLGEAFWRLRALHDAGRDTELVFSFAGHGDVSPAGEGFLVFADGPLTRRELAAQVVQASPADVNHVFIDACAAYFMVNGRGPGDEKTAPAVPLSPAMRALVAPSSSSTNGGDAWARTGVVVSTSDAAAVHESSALGAGVFSYLLRSALSGAADSDGDGDVEYVEAAAFIAAAGAGIDDPRARLQVHAKAPQQRPHAALVDLHRGADRRRVLTIDTAVAHVRLLDQHGLPFVELRRGVDDRPRSIALSGSDWFVVQVGDTEATIVPRTAGARALSSLRFSPAPRARGDDGAGPFAGLFTTAYDDSFVAGFVATSSSPSPLMGPAYAPLWAVDGAPAVRVPWSTVATGAFVGAGVFAVGAGVAAGLNLAAFAELQEGFARTATIDPAQAIAVEGWRTTATAAAALGLASTVVGVGAAALAAQEQP